MFGELQENIDTQKQNQKNSTKQNKNFNKEIENIKQH